MAAAVKDFILHCGTSFRETITWKNADGTKIDLDNYMVWAQVRPDNGGEIAIEFTNEAATVVPDGEDGVTLILTPEQTGALREKAGLHRYDMLVTEIVTGDTTRLLTGDFAIRDTITRED